MLVASFSIGASRRHERTVPIRARGSRSHNTQLGRVRAVVEGATRAGAREYLELEGYHATGSELYVGGEVGRLGNGTGVDRDGIPIQDLRFRWLEGNVKGGVDLRHALSLDYGAGVALFYVEGREVTMASGQTFIDRLSDFGYGTQIFADFNWRAHHLILGLDVKYQEAYDLVDVDYSNFRLGAHLGIAF